MKLKKSKKKYLLLILIIILALGLRFINFKESLYFGYDEARDAFISQNIYLLGDIKISGPPASVFKGINHGPLYLYIIGPLFLVGKGDPYFVSILFRLINTAGIILIFFLGTLYFNHVVGLIAAFVFATSFEQYQYAIFTGNPSLSNVSWLILFIGAGLLYKHKDKRILGLTLMLLGASLITQFDLILSYSFGVVFILLVLMKGKLQNIQIKDWFKAVAIGLAPIYTYPIAEIKNNFLGLKTLAHILTSKVSILREGESEFSIFVSNIIKLFRDNILSFSLSDSWIAAFLLLTLLFLIFKAKQNFVSSFIAVWILSLSFLILTKGFMPYYSYAGVGIGLIVGTSLLINEIIKKNKLIGYTILVLVFISNLTLIYYQSTKALIVEIKAQPGMKLSDEIRLINKTYEYANGNGFTIRTTSMPYKVQTVWAYLYKQYGLNNYGYLPFFETGNVEGFPGTLPVPKQGTSCTRYLIREPSRGIPENLLIKDFNEENLFSEVIKEEYIGNFVLQTRKAKDKNCHNRKPIDSL